MREIKFRAWNDRFQEMFNVDVLAISPVMWDTGGTGVSLAYQPHVEVMQYTGLKDKNDNEIYEGDIYKAINRNFESEVRGKITYLHGCYMFGNWNAQEFFNKHQHIEVIGNIYQNPNLLEESQ